MNDDIAEAVRQWLAQAQEDWDSVEILTQHYRCPRKSVSFHCQQYVEKLLKALLTLHQVEFPKTHYIRRLIQLSGRFAPELSKLTDASDKLTVHGVQTRYPDDWIEISELEMEEIIDLTKQFQSILIPLLK